MRYLVLLTFLFCAQIANAQIWEDRRVFQSGDPAVSLRIISSTDTAFLEPIIDEFVALNPEVAVEYLVMGTADIDGIFRAAPDTFDVVISSAMDLQLKLVNDGFAAKVTETVLPDWAKWRQSLFAFTVEPAAIVINRAAFQGRDVPQTRQELIKALRDRPYFFAHNLGTYDVRRSGLGYLFATQDARASETYWRLMEVMGGLGTRLYCCSGEMLDDLASGDIAVAYNVLGSYAEARSDIADKIQIILPSDFPTTMMRTAMVSDHAPHPDASAAFVRHLIATQTNTAMTEGGLRPIDTGITRPTIHLEPALMTYLDRLKRRTFIKEWENAIIQ